MSKRIIAIIDKDGNLKTDFRGYIGKSCLDDARKMKESLEALGIDLEMTEFIAKTAETMDVAEEQITKK